jgi:hypothetical protein
MVMPNQADKHEDWVGQRWSFFLAWGVPTIAMITAIWLAVHAKTLIWAVSLIWMGGACLMNARRYSRTHCYFTGPFFLIMSVAVLLHGLAIVSFGSEGWKWLGITIAAGGGGLWFLTEKARGKFLLQSHSFQPSPATYAPSLQRRRAALGSGKCVSPRSVTDTLDLAVRLFTMGSPPSSSST